MSTMSLERSKTPITCLHEICTKRGMQPVYELLETDDSLFMFRVTAGDCSAVGKGASKKKAKHNAASNVLVQLMPGYTPVMNNTFRDCFTSSSLSPSTEEAEIDSDVNYIGELQELSQRNLWPLPVYECFDGDGLGNEHLFHCRVRLLSLTETGVGRSKKKAKRNAAENLLNLIKNGSDVKPISHQNNLSDIKDANSQTYDRLHSVVSSLKVDQRIQTLTPKDSLEISQFYQGLKYRTGKTLASLQVLALNIPATNYCQMLQEIAEEQNFAVVFADITDLTVNGQYQCLVQLASKPVAVCQGVGRSTDEARSNAAHNALQYLKIMTRKLVK